MIDWQGISTALVGTLCGIIWYEVRQLRHAKHANAQSIQYALMCIAVVAKHVKCELPEQPKDPE